MKIRIFSYLGIALTGLALHAGNDVDLNLNGKFRGATADAASIPGWFPDNVIGNYRVLPGKDAGEFRLEIASKENAKSISSEFHPVAGNRLKVELEYSGSGTAAVTCFFHNAQKMQIGQGETMSLIPANAVQERKLYFAIPSGGVFVRIVLSAGKNSTVRFEDVEAECKIDRAQTAMQVSTGTSRAPSSGIPAEAIPVAHEQRIYYRDVPVNVQYRGQTFLGSDFELKLGEDSSKQLFWQVTSYNPEQCLIKIDHDHDGIGSWNWDKAEIELKPLVRGTIQVDFQCGPKRATVYLNVQ